MYDADRERILSRFYGKVRMTESCWVWVGSRFTKGYGRFWLHGRIRLAHKIAYEMLVGPVPVGLEIDHICRNRACVNPRHLEPVTHAENVRRGLAGESNRLKTDCPRGHTFDEMNTMRSNNQRYCRECMRAHSRAWRAKQRAYRAI